MLSLASVLSGCHFSSEDRLFQIDRVTASQRANGLEVRLEKKLAFSREARHALRNGVPLVLEQSIEVWRLEDRDLLAKDTRSFQIRYLPLSDHYELEHDGLVSNYPRLRHLLSELSRGRTLLPSEPVKPGAYEIKARFRLDQQRLPPPMRLPALISVNWHHDSGETLWPWTADARG